MTISERRLSSPSERNIVVELLTARGGGAAATTPPATARLFREGRRRSGSGRGTPAAATAAEHLQLVADDLGRVTVIPLLVLPLARAQAALDIHLRSLLQVLGGDLCQASEERHAVPLGALLLLAALLVAPALAGRNPQV